MARALLGKKLVTAVRGRETSGVIVEVEAYLGSNDPGCHTFRGETPRNAMMFKAPGHCYVYLIYGMYHCVNVVSDPVGVGSAVLIRAIEPLEGVDVMRRRRGLGRIVKERDLARGPGRLCQALGITRAFLGEHFEHSKRIWIEPYRDVSSRDIQVSGRIGLTQGCDLPLRFFIRGSRWVSGPSKSKP